MNVPVTLTKSELTRLVYLAQSTGDQKLADKLKIAFVDFQLKPKPISPMSLANEDRK